MTSRQRPAPLIGAMRRRLVLEAPVRADDGMGGATQTWTAIATLHGEVVPLSGGEANRAGRRTGTVTHAVTIRDRADVTARHRFRLGSRILEIRAVLGVGTLTPRLRCLCEERDL